MADEARESIHIQASPEKCYAVAIDFDRYPEWATDVKYVEVLELRLVVSVPRVAAAVDVEVAARHHAAAPKAGQRPDPVLADHMAPPPASTYSFSCFMAFCTIMPAAAFFMNPGSGTVMSTART